MPTPFRLAPISLAALLILPACSNSQAEPKAGDKFGDWLYECRAISANNAKCNLTQTIVANQGNQRILEINILNIPENSKTATLSVLLPLGIYLPTGVTAAVISEKTTAVQDFPIPLMTCIKNGCIASTTLNIDQLTSLRGGTKLAISFAANAKDKPLVVHGSLTGITDGLAALKLN